ncbi:hypothetical protein D8S78_19730 [Natrialba swarupiae]|nr:hypothetical protein [Natrialba swarupiae]
MVDAEENPYQSNSLNYLLRKLCDIGEIDDDGRQITWLTLRDTVGKRPRTVISSMFENSYAIHRRIQCDDTDQQSRNESESSSALICRLN